MAKFLDKIGNVFFHPEEEEYYEEEAVVEEEPVAAAPAPQAKDVFEEPVFGRNKKNQVVSMPQNTGKKSLDMVLIKAKSYDDMQTIAQNIKDRKVVIVNFEDMDKETAQRMVDFLSGAVYALNGSPSKVSGSTFLFSSSQVDLQGRIMDGETGNAFDGSYDYSAWRK